MKDITFKDENGNNMSISIIGYFKVDELDKEFIMYGLVDDDSSNEDGHVLLGEVLREENDTKILGIESSEKDLVIAYYNEVINQIGGSLDE